MKSKKVVITIGRQYGSGGKEIGSKLANSLGIDFYDKQILRMVSDESGIGESYYHLADEKAGSNLLYRIVKSMKPALTTPSVDSDLVSGDNLFLFQSEVLRKLADEKSCVIVGRCGDYILEDRDYVAKVFLYSKMENRIKKIMKRDSISEKEAVKMIKRHDKERNEYYEYYTGKSWGDINNYHLSIDSGELGVDKTVELIQEYLKIKEIIE